MDISALKSLVTVGAILGNIGGEAMVERIGRIHQLAPVARFVAHAPDVAELPFDHARLQGRIDQGRRQQWLDPDDVIAGDGDQVIGAVVLPQCIFDAAR